MTISRFDRLTDMIYVQVSGGSDVLLDISDCITLLEGIERLRGRVETDNKHALKYAQMAQAERIATLTASEYGFELGEIQGKRRKGNIVAAKHAAIKRIAAACPALSCIDIKKVMKVDHTTVLFALNRINSHRPKGGLKRETLRHAA